MRQDGDDSGELETTISELRFGRPNGHFHGGHAHSGGLEGIAPGREGLRPQNSGPRVESGPSGIQDRQAIGRGERIAQTQGLPHTVERYPPRAYAVAPRNNGHYSNAPRAQGNGKGTSRSWVSSLGWGFSFVSFMVCLIFSIYLARQEVSVMADQDQFGAIRYFQ